MTIAYFNGEFRPLEEIHVSPLDRGYLFGDGVYEVIPVYAGVLFRAREHLLRLESSLAKIRIEDSLGLSAWTELLEELVERNGGGHQSLYLQVTRGVAPRDHVFPDTSSPSVFAMTRIKSVDPEIAPVRVITRPDIRWQRCDIKSIALLANVLMRQEADDESAAEAVFIRDGFVTEGAASNVFVVTSQIVRTPPKGPHILPGITRDLVLELAGDAGLTCVEEPVSEGELRGADEIWITSSTKEVTPVTRLDDKPVANATPGPAWARVHEAFQDFKQTLVAGVAD